MNFKLIILVLIIVKPIMAQDLLYREEFKINQGTNGTADEPAIIKLENGEFITCWTEFDRKNSIFFRRLNTSLERVGVQHSLNNDKISHQYDPSITALSNGGFALCWAQSNEIYCQLFDSTGNDINCGFLVDSTDEAHKREPVVCGLPGHNIFISWIDYDQSDWGIWGLIIDQDGNRISDVFQVNSCTTGNQGEQSIAVISEENFLVTYSTNDGVNQFWAIHGQIFDSAGRRIGEEYVIDSGEYCSNPCVIDLNNGTFVAFWNREDPDERGIHYICGQIFDSQYEKVGSQFIVCNYNNIFPLAYSATSLDSNFIVCWRNRWPGWIGYNILGKRFDQCGNEAGATFSISDDIECSFNDISLTSSKGGGFVITWPGPVDGQSTGAIYGSYFLDRPLLHRLTPFDILQPANDATIDTLDVTFTWRQASTVKECYPDEITYDLYLSQNIYFDPCVRVKDILDTSYVHFNLNEDRTYFWKVFAKNIAGDSLLSYNMSGFYITPEATSPIAIADRGEPDAFALYQNYPNPFNAETRIRYLVDRRIRVRLKIYDITGQHVQTLVDEIRNPGMHSATLKADHLPSGIYILQMQAAEQQWIKKALLIK